MKAVENAFEEFVDAIESARDAAGFERVAMRLTQKLGFQRFAYLNLAGEKTMLISSYPKHWTNRYFDLQYQELDPVVRRARHEYQLFGWGGAVSDPSGNREQRRFFDEAMTFGIRSGVTVPIRGGFGRVAAFTLATGDRDVDPDRLTMEWRAIVQAVGIHFHDHVAARIAGGRVRQQLSGNELTQRERQCLTWTAQGKTVADIAVLVGIARRTVVFHLENARRKLGAVSIAQCVAEALRRSLLS